MSFLLIVNILMVGLLTWSKLFLNLNLMLDIKLDDLFIKDRSRIFLDIERTLAQKRLEESKQSINEKTLNDAKSTFG